MRKIITCITACLFFYCSGNAQSKQIQYLSGTGSDKTVTWDFFCTGGRKSGYWTSIQVPSCWEQQGFGSYNYGRDYKTYGKNFRLADEKGIYRHSFSIPAGWKGKQVSIVFEGSMTDTEVKVNGQSAGAIHQGAFYRFSYDITDKIKPGQQNLLEVSVSKMSADPSVNNAERLADYWVFGGIFRPVYLEAVNREHIKHTAIDARANGDFTLQAQLQNISESQTLLAEIIDSKGKVAGRATAKLRSGDTIATIKTTIQHALQWTSETPQLYNAKIYLKAANKTIFQSTEKFGFRSIEIRAGEGIYINGVQVKMKGVNRHCFSPETGRTLNDSLQLLDALLLKEMNMNAVRCSHYPPDVRFLEICDSLGLYVIDELAGWQKAYSTKAGEPLVKEMVLRDVNHPSIIFWANGNEGGTNKQLDDDFLKWDISRRPVIHPHHRPGNSFNGIDCNHYEDYFSSKKILNDSAIYMPTEFLHAQDDGGAGAAMYDFWDLHWNAKKSGGGFIWAMLDEGLVRTDRNNVIDANGLNANDGILGPHREKEGSFFALREIFSPVRIEMTSLPSNFDGSILLENRYHFTNLIECGYQWALVNYRKPFDAFFDGYSVQQKGLASVASIAPGATGKLSLNLPTNYKAYDALVLWAKDKFGKEIYKWTWKIKSNEALLKDISLVNDSSTAVVETDSSYILKGGDISLSLSKKSGLLLSAKSASSGMPPLAFNNGPLLVAGTGELQSSELYKDGKNTAVKFTYNGNMKYTKWTMSGTGWVSLEYEYEIQDTLPFAGVSFNYPENFMLGAKWLGKGPYRQWKNRTHGTAVNVWQQLYNDSKTSYYPFVYPEFKGYYTDITWMEFNSVEGKFYVASKDSGLSIRLFDFYGLSGLQGFPALPVGNISFLDCIPPIGTKLALNINADTKSLGPQSEQTIMHGPVKRTLYFYFGLPKTIESKELYSRPETDDVF